MKTHCRRGHEFVEATTYRPPDGSRECAICRDERKAIYRSTHKKEIQTLNRRFYLQNTARVKQVTWAYAKTERGRQVQQRAQRKFRSTAKSKSAKSKYKRTEKGKQTNARDWRKRAYGLTAIQYETMLREQHGLCKICSIFMTSPQIDHSHRTGVVRALLCKLCNMGLGSFNDSPTRLRNAAEYLEKF